ncbi:MAG: DUF434 domain-containing protein [Deltaproteobacteria bacterium]|nr:DUF434 domain-containing protein [Deltaproteobacteria bacterium]
MSGQKVIAELRAAPLQTLRAAADDFRYLLGRGYPRTASLTLVGNRYQLAAAARQILHRGVFDLATAHRRRLKLRLLGDCAGQPLALDGHNVLITLECSLRGLPLTAADDGFIRDIGQISQGYRPSPVTAQALELIIGFLKEQGVSPVLFWYDAPLSRSGELAATTRNMLRQHKLAGDAQAVPVPEKHLLAWEGIVASSDTHVIDRSQLAVDPAGEIIRQLPHAWIISLLAGDSPETSLHPGE